jgi:hypothetical protein
MPASRAGLVSLRIRCAALPLVACRARLDAGSPERAGQDLVRHVRDRSGQAAGTLGGRLRLRAGLGDIDAAGTTAGAHVVVIFTVGDAISTSAAGECVASANGAVVTCR